MFLPDGALAYSVGSTEDGSLAVGSLEIGLKREASMGFLRPFVAGTTGVAYVDQKGPGPAPGNDRRPDVGPRHFRETATTPVAGISAGLGIHAPLRLGIVFAAEARWLPLRDLVGPEFPISAAIAWPEPEASAATTQPATRRLPHLRITTGPSAMGSPAGLRSSTHSGLSTAIELDQPVWRGVALSVEGVNALRRSEPNVVVRQETDPFGNLVNIYSRAPTSFTITALTTGLRLSGSSGAFSLTSRAGLGAGRIGGFGRTFTVTGETQSGTSLETFTVTEDVGAGAQRTGLAWSAGIGAEVRLFGSVALAVDAGAMALCVDRMTFVVVPVRAGFVLQ